MSNQRWSGLASWIALVLLLTSVGMNALQARRIRELVEPPGTRTSRVGQVASPMTGLSVTGERRTIHFEAGQPTVVYFFSPSCRWCEENWANVRALATASPGRFRFLAVAAEMELREFARERQLDFEILGGVSPETRQSFGFSATPHTVVVSSQGQISQEWTGAFNGRRQRAVESFFEIRLPGLARAMGTR